MYPKDDKMRRHHKSAPTWHPIEYWLEKYDFTEQKGKLSTIKWSEFAREMVKMHPYGFRGGIVYGDRRIGKSIYSLKVMVEIFKAFGCSVTDAWELAFSSLYFDPRHLLETIELLASRKLTWPVVTLDDAGVGAGKHIWFTDRDLYYAMNSVIQTVGTVFSGFILTTPNFQRMLDAFRDAQDIYRIEVRYNGTGWERKADAYLIKLLPSGTIRIRSKRDPQSGFVDEFSAYLVNKYYARYINIRWPYTQATAQDALSKIKRKGRVMKGDYAKLGELKAEIDSILEAQGKEKQEKKKAKAQT